MSVLYMQTAKKNTKNYCFSCVFLSIILKTTFLKKINDMYPGKYREVPKSIKPPFRGMYLTLWYFTAPVSTGV